MGRRSFEIFGPDLTSTHTIVVSRSFGALPGAVVCPDVEQASVVRLANEADGGTDFGHRPLCRSAVVKKGEAVAGQAATEAGEIRPERFTGGPRIDGTRRRPRLGPPHLGSLARDHGEVSLAGAVVQEYLVAVWGRLLPRPGLPRARAGCPGDSSILGWPFGDLSP